MAVGYQAVAIGGIGDPVVLDQLDSWLECGLAVLRERAEDIAPGSLVDLRGTVYGANAVTAAGGGAVPEDQAALILEVTARSARAAEDIISVGVHLLIHRPVPEYQGSVTLLALRHSPPVLSRGRIYAFAPSRLLKLEHPLEAFRTVHRTLGKSS